MTQEVKAVIDMDLLRDQAKLIYILAEEYMDNDNVVNGAGLMGVALMLYDIIGEELVVYKKTGCVNKYEIPEYV